MPMEAPLRVTAEIELAEGPAAGERRFRLTERIGLPPELHFATPLPVDGDARGRVRFRLPGEAEFSARALLRSDPERPERGARAELVDPEPHVLAAIEAYIHHHQTRTRP